MLEEAENERHPLLERLRFLSISASNLDEFYMVRVAGLRRKAAAGVKQYPPDGMSPADQLAAIRARVRTLLAARAIENTCFVVGAGQPEPRYSGHSAVLGPLGDTLASAAGGDARMVQPHPTFQRASKFVRRAY